MSLLDGAREARVTHSTGGANWHHVTISREARDALVELADAAAQWQKKGVLDGPSVDRIDRALERLRA